jgi:hypothetical protein
MSLPNQGPDAAPTGADASIMLILIPRLSPWAS